MTTPTLIAKQWADSIKELEKEMPVNEFSTPEQLAFTQIRLQFQQLDFTARVIELLENVEKRLENIDGNTR